MSRGATDLLGYMHERACFRDHIYFAADQTAANDLGVSRMTIQRRKRELERSGVVTRIEHPKFKRTVCYRMRRVTQRSYGARKSLRTPSTVPFGHSAGRVRVAAVRGRRRKLMEKHPERLIDGVVRKNGEVTAFNAGDAVAATVDVCWSMGVPVAPSVKARLGKGAKGLLEVGFDPQIVCAAMVLAVETGWFGSTETIAQELVVAKAGHRRSKQEYHRALAETSAKLAHSDSLVWQTMRDEMARREGTNSAGI